MKQGFERSSAVGCYEQTEHRELIWDPNPQLKNIELGEASVYTWKDKEGRELKGGLYQAEQLQTGTALSAGDSDARFRESEFRPSGVFPTAFAARALAATGICRTASTGLEQLSYRQHLTRALRCRGIRICSKPVGVRGTGGSGKDWHHRFQPHMFLRDGDAHDWLPSPQSCFDHGWHNGRLFPVHIESGPSFASEVEFDDRRAAIR